MIHGWLASSMRNTSVVNCSIASFFSFVKGWEFPNLILPIIRLSIIVIFFSPLFIAYDASHFFFTIINPQALAKHCPYAFYWIWFSFASMKCSNCFWSFFFLFCIWIYISIIELCHFLPSFGWFIFFFSCSTLWFCLDPLEHLYFFFYFCLHPLIWMLNIYHLKTLDHFFCVFLNWFLCSGPSSSSSFRLTFVLIESNETITKTDMKIKILG